MGSNQPRRRLAGCLAAGVVLGLSGVVAGVASHASAQEVLSAGCSFLNSSSFDVEDAGDQADPAEYVAGEVITVRTGEPAGRYRCQPLLTTRT